MMSKTIQKDISFSLKVQVMLAKMNSHLSLEIYLISFHMKNMKR